MKKLLYLALVMGMLYLTGCSEDEPQSVAFEETEIELTSEGGILYVNVLANCTWSLSESSREILIEEMQGDGDGKICINVGSNLSHGKLKHIITITSEDGTSYHTLSITQNPPLFIDAENPEVLSADGGEFTLTVYTNVKTLDVTCPEWIELQSKESVGDTIRHYNFSYSFNDEPNIKEGKIFLKYGDIARRINISQEIVQIEKVEILDWTNLLFKSSSESISFPISITPSYAPCELIRVETNNENACKAYVKDSNLFIENTEYGEFEITVSTKEHTFFKEFISIFYKYIYFTQGFGEKYVIGRNISLPVSYPSYLYEATSSNPSVIEIYNKDLATVVGEGEATITVSCPLNGSKDSVTVKGVKHILSSWRTYYVEKGDCVSLILKGVLESYKEAQITEVLITDKDYKLLASKVNLAHDGTKQVEFKTDMITIPTSSFDFSKEDIAGIRVAVTFMSDGRERFISTYVNPIRFGE